MDGSTEANKVMNISRRVATAVVWAVDQRDSCSHRTKTWSHTNRASSVPYRLGAITASTTTRRKPESRQVVFDCRP